jgi:IS5 family transposase
MTAASIMLIEPRETIKEFYKLLGINKHKNKIKTCGEVYADSAYANKKNDEKLGKQNNKVLHRAYRNRLYA